MAIGGTVRRFEIELADSDRGVYETFEWRTAQHPSESGRYLVARVLARTLEHADGVDFSRGLDVDDEPALWQKDLRGDLHAWIEIGSPATDRLHRATKQVKRVVVYTWKKADELAAAIVEAKVHRGEAIELRELDGPFLDIVAATLDRVNRWSLSITGGTIYLTANDVACETVVRAVAIGG
jgi:uncharacterized protein YaeQ